MRTRQSGTHAAQRQQLTLLSDQEDQMSGWQEPILAFLEDPVQPDFGGIDLASSIPSNDPTMPCLQAYGISAPVQYVPTGPMPMPVSRRSTSSADTHDEGYLCKRAKNNLAVKKSRAKTRQRLQELEEKCDKKQAENDSLKQQLRELQHKLDIQKNCNKNLMHVIDVSQRGSTSAQCPCKH